MKLLTMASDAIMLLFLGALLLVLELFSVAILPEHWDDANANDAFDWKGRT